MLVVTCLAILFFGTQVFLKKNENQVTWFLCSTLLLNSSLVLVNSPRISAHFFLVICFALSLFLQKRISWEEIPIKWVWLVYFVGFAIIAYKSPLLHGFSMCYKPIRLFLSSYFVLLLGFFSFRYFKFNKRLVVILLGVTLYGFFTAIIKDDPLRSLLPVDFKYSYFFGERLRVASTWSHPIAYGFVCSVFLMNLWGGIRADRNKKILAFFLLGSILICGSRTVILSAIVMFGVYLLVKGSKKEWKKMLLLLFIGCFFAFYFSSVGDKILSVVDVFFGGNQVSGSSLAMRQGQLDASFAISSKFPIFGGGFEYIQEGLGYGKKADWKYWLEYGDLYGFESYLYVLIIERGVCGIVIELVLIVSLYVWILCRRKKNKEAAARACALLTGFLSFAFMTGTLDVWVIGMYFLGVHMGILNSSVKQVNMVKT